MDHHAAREEIERPAFLVLGVRHTEQCDPSPLAGRRRQPPERRGRTALIFFILAVILAAASIPWPAMSNGRPLIRVLRFEP